jgi:hypothetical protein
MMHSALKMRVCSLFAVALVACGGDRLGPRFPLRGPMERDPDLDVVDAGCHQEDGKEVCGPREYVSSFSWDAADNTVFRPISAFFAVSPAGRARNVNAFDEVPSSSWFTNRARLARTDAEIAEGPCAGGPRIETADEGRGIVVDRGKDNGASPGFCVKIPGKGKFMLKVDTPVEPERATGATSIATRLYYAVGWNAACDSVVYLDPATFTLAPGLTITDNTGVTKPLDAARLQAMLTGASRRGARVRFVASRWLDGRPLGPFTYEGTKDDDPSDVVPHEDRRDLRGARLMAAWLDHFDSREQNSMAIWLPDASDPKKGSARHYYIDLGDCFGSQWDWPSITWRLNYAYYFDAPAIGTDFLTLGILRRPWDTTTKPYPDTVFGYFRATDFDPEAWHGGYPNPAFGRMQEADGAWFARILARFEKHHLAAAVAEGDFTDPKQTKYLLDALWERRTRILQRYLSRLAPLDVPTVAGNDLCTTDLALASGIVGDEQLHPAATLRDAAATRALPVRRAGTQLCVAIPRTLSPAVSATPDAQVRYRVLEIADGWSQGALRVHYYEQADGTPRVAGLERN